MKKSLFVAAALFCAMPLAIQAQAADAPKQPATTAQHAHKAKAHVHKSGTHHKAKSITKKAAPTTAE